MAGKKVSSVPEDALAAYDKIISTVKGIARKGASMPYTSVNGHMFSFMAADGSVALRLDAGGRDAFIKRHKTSLAEAHGTVLKEYVVVPAALLGDVSKMTKYFGESYAYVSSLKPKATKAPAGKKTASKPGKAG